MFAAPPTMKTEVFARLPDAYRIRYGTAILLVEQNLKHGLAIAERANVLNRGAKVYDGDPAELRDERRLLEMF